MFYKSQNDHLLNQLILHNLYIYISFFHITKQMKAHPPKVVNILPGIVWRILIFSFIMSKGEGIHDFQSSNEDSIHFNPFLNSI